MLHITLPGGRVVEKPAGTTAGEVLSELPEARKAVAAKVDGQVVDLSRALHGDAVVEPVLPGTPEALDVLRHTSAHVMAQAVARYLGVENVEFAIGPVIEEGFYYDFELPRRLGPEDLPKIEALIDEIRKEDLPITRIEVRDKDEAIRTLEGDRAKSRLKQEIVRGFADDAVISFYRQGEFLDLCTGPHLPSTGRVGHIKLLSIAGAYWRGDEKREQLQRIYATAFFDKAELQEFLHRREEAEKRDHRKIGQQLDLFRLLPEAPGFPFWLPNGTILFNELVAYMRQKLAVRDYQEIRTPHILVDELWKRSGHYDHYRDNMYFTQIEDRSFCVKPMSCPGAHLVFAQGLRSYRELPLRLAEFGLVHRYEPSGTLSGLTRVRSFVQDDAHQYCTLDQLLPEVLDLLGLIHEVYGELGFSRFRMLLSTRPASRTGSEDAWDRAEAALEQALRDSKSEYTLNPGDGAFYGPKIDFMAEDAIGRRHQLGTIQVDFWAPEKFDLSYVAEDGSKKAPVVIHRAILGSIERSTGILIEHYAGAFPLWLAPEQVVIVPVSEERHADAAKAALAAFRAAGLRASVDWSGEKLGKKVRNAAVRKLPYILVIGDREAESAAVSVRRRDGTDCGAIALPRVVELLAEEVRSRSLTPRIEKETA